jgi:hypothetical protein
MSNYLDVSLRNWLGTTSAPFSKKVGQGLTNGELLRQAAIKGFEVFLTGDQNLTFQQNVARAKLGVVVMAGKSNRLADLLPLVSAALKAIERSKPGQVERITG